MFMGLMRGATRPVSQHGIGALKPGANRLSTASASSSTRDSPWRAGPALAELKSEGHPAVIPTADVVLSNDEGARDVCLPDPVVVDPADCDVRQSDHVGKEAVGRLRDGFLIARRHE